MFLIVFKKSLQISRSASHLLEINNISCHNKSEKYTLFTPCRVYESVYNNFVAMWQLGTWS